MNKPQYDKSINMLEDLIMHFLVIGKFEITGVLCELLLECDDTYRTCQRQSERPPAKAGGINRNS